MGQLHPYIAILVGLFVIALLILWILLPIAVFDIKRILKKIEQNTRK